MEVGSVVQTVAASFHAMQLSERARASEEGEEEREEPACERLPTMAQRQASHRRGDAAPLSCNLCFDRPGAPSWLSSQLPA